MATTRKTAVRKTVKKPAACAACKGDGTVSIPNMVGRRGHERQHGHQDGMCLTCLGTGQTPTT